MRFCFFLLLLLCPTLHAATCAGLKDLKLAHGEITLATEVAAGAFTPAGVDKDVAPLFKTLPAFCRVTATLKPSADSEIKMEVWMPLTGWNKRLEAQGNGGFAGTIYRALLAHPLLRGSAAAETDTGHESPDATDARWALNHPEKITDFGWRAIHEMTLATKAIIQAFYSAAPEHSYFNSCSNGGRQGLMEAQRFPADYDGILAGAPANYWTRLLASFGWDINALHETDASSIPTSKLSVIAAGVLKACDALDGVKDGILNDPRACHFNPDVLLCKGGSSSDCLTAPQVAALKKIYAGPRTASGALIDPPFPPGGETGADGWDWMTGPHPAQQAFFEGFMRYMLLNDPSWSFKSFNLERDFKLADDKQGATFNAADPDLSKFRARGGKLIIYHGWSDAAIPALDSIKYFDAMRSKMGVGTVDGFARLYLAPGMHHCGGGDAPNSFGQLSSDFNPDSQRNLLLSLMNWVEKGTTPGTIIAVKTSGFPAAKAVQPTMTRPLCAYPQLAKYKGAGDTNDAANFACVASK